jgi:hypothetical protein
MGAVEKEAKIIRRRTSVQKILLGTLLATGVVSLAVFAPNAM